MKIEKGLLRTSLIVGAIIGIGTAAMAFGEWSGTTPVLTRDFILAQQKDEQTQAELKEQIEQTQQVQQLQRFQILEMKRKFDPLNFDEIMERCKIAQALGYPMSMVDGCK